MHDGSQRHPGKILIQFYSDKEKAESHGVVTKAMSFRLDIHKIFPPVPAEIPLTIPAPPEPGTSPKLATNTVICLSSQREFIEGSNTMLHTLLHEAKMLTDIEHLLKAKGHQTPHPNIVQFKGFVTAKFDEIPASQNQVRVVDIKYAPELPPGESLGRLAEKYFKGVESARLTPEQIRIVKRDIKAAMDDLHSIGYIHVRKIVLAAEPY